MTNKQGHKNTTTATSHYDDTHKHTKPIDIPYSNGGEKLQEDRPVANVLDTSSQRREHRGKPKAEEHPSQKPSETADTAGQPGKEDGSPSSTHTSGSFGAADNKNDPMRASTRTRTMSLYEMHAPYMS